MELTKEIIRRWRNERLQEGQKKYKDDHLQRNGVDDVREELIDVMNICELINDRVETQRMYGSGLQMEKAEQIWEKTATLQIMSELSLMVCDQLENMMPKELLTDEKGGERVFITEWRKNNE